ncbi:MAG TPA: hypothetical protein VGT41_06035 [Candidatus Babeliales bacterium]|nr:hypothetical protein [Candidatus Babeliales bacterium]
MKITKLTFLALAGIFIGSKTCLGADAHAQRAEFQSAQAHWAGLQARNLKEVANNFSRSCDAKIMEDGKEISQCDSDHVHCLLTLQHGLMGDIKSTLANNSDAFTRLDTLPADARLRTAQEFTPAIKALKNAFDTFEFQYYLPNDPSRRQECYAACLDKQRDHVHKINRVLTTLTTSQDMPECGWDYPNDSTSALFNLCEQSKELAEKCKNTMDWHYFPEPSRIKNIFFSRSLYNPIAGILCVAATKAYEKVKKSNQSPILMRGIQCASAGQALLGTYRGIVEYNKQVARRNYLACNRVF